MAFISVTANAFLGEKTRGYHATRQVSTTPNPSTVTMKWGLDKMLAKYAAMAATGPAGTTPQPTTYSKPSAVWKTYSKSILDKTAPTRRQMYAPKGSYEDMMSALAMSSFLFKAPGGAPAITKADTYIADCATLQYKQSACPNGEYSVQCTEGTVRGQAEDSRTLALGARFRRSQRSTNAKFGDTFETRRRAIIQANMCDYEEKLSIRFPQAASAVVTGYSEKSAICVRYATGNSPQARYMIDSVDKQYKMKAVAGGVYEVMCQDGAAKGLPEYKRVQALSAKFRAQQMSKIAKEDAKFEASRYARAQYALGCDYEEAIFNVYPAVAATMRPSTARY